MPALNWQKSSYSEQASSCVFVAAVGDGSLRIRESDEPDIVLRTTPDALRALIRGVKAADYRPGR